MRALLAAGCNRDAKSGAHGATALLYAACFGHAGVVAALLAEGADASVADRDGWTALDWAIEKEHHAIVVMLAPTDPSDGGAAPPPSSSSAAAAAPPLVPAPADVPADHSAAVVEGADDAKKTDEGSCAHPTRQERAKRNKELFHAAAVAGDASLAQQLLERGIQPDGHRDSVRAEE